MRWQIRSVICFGVVLVIFWGWNGPVLGDEQQPPFSFQVSKSDAANAVKLADQLASLSPRVNRDEAKLLADCAFVTVSKLRREYRMFGTPIFNNFLIYHGLRKRGYCYQWSEDLLLALDQLNLKSLELRWGEYDPNTWRENNCIVVTAKGRPFKRGNHAGVLAASGTPLLRSGCLRLGDLRGEQRVCASCPRQSSRLEGLRP